MDSERFDSLTRSWSTLRSRRGALRALAGTVLGGGLATLALEAEAGTRLGGAACTKNSQCKSNRCLANDTCSCRNAAPAIRCKGAGQVCRQRECCTPCGTNCCGVGEVCADKATNLCVVGMGTCRLGDDNCAVDNESFPCGPRGGEINPSCTCHETMAGPTRCGAGQLPCGVCTTDADCVTRTGNAGAFCIRDTGPACGCATGEGFCATPCPG